MKDTKEDAFCPNCEWTGDAAGMTSCPVCGSSLSSLESFQDDDLTSGVKDRYPENLQNIKEDDDEYLE